VAAQRKINCLGTGAEAKALKALKRENDGDGDMP